MSFAVEPRDGQELDRMITALLNATGVVHCLVESENKGGDLAGEQVIGRCAQRMRATLAAVAEHHDDDALALVTQITGTVALVLAEDLGVSGAFYPRRRPGL